MRSTSLNRGLLSMNWHPYALGVHLIVPSPLIFRQLYHRLAFYCPSHLMGSAALPNLSPSHLYPQSGSVALPLFCGYNASKFGLEALSDCLRYELHTQGIKV